MTLQSALILILSILAAWLYIQSRADKARKELSRLSAYEYWADRTFKAVEDILQIKNFPAEDLTLMSRVIDLIDQKTAANSLHLVFHDREKRDHDAMSQASREFFLTNDDADEAYMEFFYSSMMTLSYLDNWGDLVRPRIEDLKNRKLHSSIEISSDVREAHWLPASRPVAA